MYNLGATAREEAPGEITLPAGTGTGCRRPHVRQRDHGPTGRKDDGPGDQPLLHGVGTRTGNGRSNPAWL